MSDNEKKIPSKQTSSVPLKKETVRVTLKAADAPPSFPSATLPATPPPSAPPVRPPTPGVGVVRPPTPTAGYAGGSPSPTAAMPPTATIPTPTGPPTAPRPTAPTVPLRTAGAPTIRLATTNAPIGAPTIALKTANSPLPGGGTGKATVALPKATVALNPPTRPLSPTSPSGTQQMPTLSEADDSDESGAGTFMKILAGVGLVAALVVLGLQLKVSDIWISAKDAETPGDWSQLLE